MALILLLVPGLDDMARRDYGQSPTAQALARLRQEFSGTTRPTA